MNLSSANLRTDSLALFQTGLAAADPRDAVRQCLRVDDGTLRIMLDPKHPDTLRQGQWRNIHLMAIGKAACAMAEAACEVIPASLLASRPIVVTHYANVRPNPNFDLLGAGHPLPDAAGVRAAEIVIERLSHTKAGELVLVLLSGGGSALLPSPADGITLADKIRITEQLLASGATIDAINCVRKHLSKLKGGGLARHAHPADVHALILSDVMGDDPSAIASGPTVADATTFADAIAVLQNHGCWQDAPAAIKHHLQQGALGLRPETLKADDPILAGCRHSLIGSNRHSVDAMVEHARALGYDTTIHAQPLCGEARIIAAAWAADVSRLSASRTATRSAWVAGGETTVTLGKTLPGIGGRNQELALAFALAAERHELRGDWCFLSGGSDGCDGPTDAAGALVDGGSLHRCRQAGIDPLAALADHNAYPALKAAGDLLLTGATGTNVADLQILLMRSTPD
ncbi:MAG: glycerate kinase [Methylomonas sp.]|nr:MAG: glycerate kinase [Methylomonas sp.]PPD26763.1 MAG: glycerate kinase [Methylomonas sp.]PPD38598.1 MAG: glycerate kinase [Methylomonas sp.]PPD42783.1 MAG: glycerate kinase [Methylomonas sp.]PPD55958.1 MAG: glycerate kinase [Methylomonas sp.]